MYRQSTVSSNASSKDKEHVPYLRRLRKTVAALATLARKQRVCKSMFDSIKIMLETLDNLLDGSESMKILFKKGKEFENRELSDNEENRIRNLLEIEANLPKLNRLCAALVYSADIEDADKYRLGRKLVSLYDAPHKYNELMGLVRRVSGALHNIAADPDITEEGGGFFDAFNELDLSSVEEQDAARVAQKLENHVEAMSSNRYFTNECDKVKAQFESAEIDTSSMLGLIDFISTSALLRDLRRRVAIEVYKFGAKTRVEIIDQSIDTFKEKFIPYKDIDLEKLYHIEKHSDYTRRFQKPYIVSCFGYFNDPENRGFQLCTRHPETTLEQFMADSDDFSAETILHFIVQIIDAVKFSHESLEPVGDLRPKSILVKHGSKPQLVLLSVLNDLESAEQAVDDEILDKARYMAPELLVGHDDLSIGRKTKTGDVYAIGMLVWEMMQKKKPYSSVDDLEHLIDLKGKGSHPSKLLDEEDDLIAHLEYSELLNQFFAQTWNPNPLRRPIPKKLTKKKSPLKKMLKTLG